jgi:hypothetical protein
MHQLLEWSVLSKPQPVRRVTQTLTPPQLRLKLLSRHLWLDQPPQQPLPAPLPLLSLPLPLLLLP